MTEESVRKVATKIAGSVKRYVQQVFAKTETRLDALEKRIAQLEAKQ